MIESKPRVLVDIDLYENKGEFDKKLSTMLFSQFLLGTF